MSTSTPFDQLDPTRKRLAYEKASQHVQEVKTVVPPELQRLQAEILRRARAQSLRSSVPPIFQQFFKPSRYKGAHGGRGSAKSWSFGTMVLDRCIQKKGSRIVCVREVQKSLEQSVKRLLEDLIKLYSLGAEFRILGTQIETPGGGVIIFQGMQDHTAESIKSLEGYDVAWVEEAQSVSERSLTLLRPTIRKEDSELWFTWNPRRQSDPIDKLLRGPTLPPDAVVVQATYYDNPFLPEVLRTEMEWDKGRDPDKYEHVWLGGYEKNSEARVFRNWTQQLFETPRDASFLFGGDWGFATDPDVLVRGFVVQPKTLCFDYEAYKIGCEIDDTPKLFDGLVCGCDYTRPDEPCRKPEEHGMARAWRILTDSARPETISYMQKHGYPRVVGAKKGPGSIEEGIKFLKGYDIVLHARLLHMYDEFASYCFKRDPLTNNVIPVLADKKNHVIDSARYSVEDLRTPVEPDFVTW